MNTTVNLGSLVNPEVIASGPEFHGQYLAATPFRHVVIDDFFSDSFCSQLCDAFPSFDEKRALNEDGRVGGKSTQERVTELGPVFRELDALVQDEAFLGWVGNVTGIADLQYDPGYFGGGTHENREGQELDPHIDFNYHPLTHQHRRLNLIVYLNEGWQESWGGALQLHRDPHLPRDQDEVVTVVPLLNRCVIFETTEHSWHGFEKIRLPAGRNSLSRRSFALYYYTYTRPASETATEHSTVYVERPLPGRFKAGLTLGEHDVQELQLLLQRRDQHLDRLYRKVKSLYGELNQLRYRINPHEVERLLEGKDGDISEETLRVLLRQTLGRVNELEQSTSWRLTAPLRAARRWLAGRG